MSNQKPETETPTESAVVAPKNPTDTENRAERKIEIIRTDDPSMDDTLLEEMEVED